MMPAFALVAAAITVTVHTAGRLDRHDRTCAPAMDSAFVHLLPSTKTAGTLLQPLAMRPLINASSEDKQHGHRGCAEFVG